jgi:hypothetical protein
MRMARWFFQMFRFIPNACLAFTWAISFGASFDRAAKKASSSA